MIQGKSGNLNNNVNFWLGRPPIPNIVVVPPPMAEIGCSLRSLYWFTLTLFKSQGQRSKLTVTGGQCCPSNGGATSSESFL